MTEMSPVEAIFFAAAALTPEDRAAYLDRVCVNNPELRQRVEAMLSVRPDVGGFLEPAAEDDVVALDLPSKDEYLGTILGGKYKLIEVIGEGGMGTVFMAQQLEPVKRAVAVKVIKAGMDSKAVLARFEAERQALAMMDHPNIARVLDAGTAETGRPYFVMELVKGIPITQFCDERRLTPRQRLELFVPVCNAIQHAHMKGIIHRDIKPNNVLVALYDDHPVPKVIDFGIAKAAGQSLTDMTLMTGFGSVVGTPEYMSPEQASMNQLDVDTRSDVYSLGVLLYELLTGTTPVDRKSLGQAAILEILRIVREVEAPRPSIKLNTIETLPSVAANRSTEPKKLTATVKGELDWVLLKALEKDRSRRYETANGFAADINSYLSGGAVIAHPPTRWYRLRKAIQRNKAATIVAFCVCCIAFSATSVSLWSWGRLYQERYLFEENKYERDRLTAQSTSLRTREEDLRRLGAETWSLASYEFVAYQSEYTLRMLPNDVNFPRNFNPGRDSLINDPVKDFPPSLRFAAAWHWGISRGYFINNELGMSLSHLTKALNFAERGFGKADPMTIQIRCDLAMIYHIEGRNEEAREVIILGDRYCREAVEADPAVLAVKYQWRFISMWRGLIAQGLFLPPRPNEPPFEDELWKQMDTICLKYKEKYSNIRPERTGYPSQNLTTSFRGKLPPRVQEFLIRKDVEKSSRTPMISKAGYNEHSDSLKMLAYFLISQGEDRFQEAEETLLGCIPTMREPLVLKTTELDDKQKDMAVRNRILGYRDCLAMLIDLYEKWNKPEEARKWIAAFREYERTTTIREPKRKFKFDPPEPKKSKPSPKLEVAPPPREKK
ncbi:MAG: protein kinase domain-containing protein [Fimbriiglobus sp.]